MKEFERKAKRKKKLCSNFVILILLIILAFFINETVDVYIKAREGRKTLESAQTNMEELNDRKEKLKSNIDYLKSDIGKEEKVRNNFLVAKEGEKAIFIIDEEEEEEEEEVREEGVFLNVWESILNLFN